jgi:6-phosphofructokinase
MRLLDFILPLRPCWILLIIVRSTLDALERIFLIEEMGRYAGFLELNAAVAFARGLQSIMYY